MVLHFDPEVAVCIPCYWKRTWVAMTIQRQTQFPGLKCFYCQTEPPEIILVSKLWAEVTP